MDVKAYWELIDKTREASNGDSCQQHDLLVEELAQLPESEIHAFRYIDDDLMDEAYRAALWEAAYIINSGCSDDGFLSFREWLIGRGEEVFYNALKNPESLIDVIEPGDENMYPTMLGVAYKAYERVTGKDGLPLRTKPLAELQGELSPEEKIEERFPKLTEKFSPWWASFWEKVLKPNEPG